MRSPAPNEKRLLVILAAALFLAANMLGLRAFAQARAKARASVTAAKAALSEEQAWAGLAGTFLPAERWIDSHPMPELTPNDASAELLRQERGAAEGAGLKVLEETLSPAATTSQGSAVGVAMKVSGPFAGMVRFLFAMQTPTAWRTVDKLTLRSDAEPPNVVAELELRQLFRSAGNAPGSPLGSPAPHP
jgi:hypothetical protein